METVDVDWVVIGAGAVGAACAHELCRTGASVFVLEKEMAAGRGTTSRNSGVIHAGIYYPKDSLKADLCIRGNQLLYEWCERHRVSYLKCGKVITAADESDVPLMEKLYASAIECGARGLEIITAKELSDREPLARGVAGIWSATTGIVDGESLTKSLLDSAIETGLCDVLFGAEIKALEKQGDNWLVTSSRGEIRTRGVVNSAGLYADEVAKLAQIDSYTIHPCRGDYFKLTSDYRFRTLVYPTKKPGAPGLGIHVTLDLAGFARLGPDAEYVASKTDYAPRPDKHEKFFEASKKLIPNLKREHLTYDMAGIRPKLRAQAEPAEKDFVISQDKPGLINLVGIESPGLTASVAIAERVRLLASR